MNIRIRDKYAITGEVKDFVVSNIKVYKNGDQKDEEYLSDKSYHGSLDAALNDVFKRGLLKSDATTLGEVLSEIKDFRKELQELFNLNLDTSNAAMG